MTQIVAAFKKEPLIALAIVGILAQAVYSVARGGVDVVTAEQAAATAIAALVARSLVSPKWKAPKAGTVTVVSHLVQDVGALADEIAKRLPTPPQPAPEPPHAPGPAI